MKRLIFSLLLIAMLFPGAVAGQQASDNATVVQQENETEGCDVRVDRNTRICESSFENGRSELVIYSNRTQSVTISDRGSFAKEGPVPRQTVTLQEGRNRVSIEGERARGQAGVSIDTDLVLYSHIIDDDSTLIAGPFDGRDVQIAAVSGALSVALIVLFKSWRYLAGTNREPEKVVG